MDHIYISTTTAHKGRTIATDICMAPPHHIRNRALTRIPRVTKTHRPGTVVPTRMCLPMRRLPSQASQTISRPAKQRVDLAIDYFLAQPFGDKFQEFLVVDDCKFNPNYREDVIYWYCRSWQNGKRCRGAVHTGALRSDGPHKTFGPIFFRRGHSISHGEGTWTRNIAQRALLCHEMCMYTLVRIWNISQNVHKQSIRFRNAWRHNPARGIQCQQKTLSIGVYKLRKPVYVCQKAAISQTTRIWAQTRPNPPASVLVSRRA